MIRVCPHSDSKCVHGMGCTFSCATGEYDGTKRAPDQSAVVVLEPCPSTDFVLMPVEPTEEILHRVLGIHPKAAKKGALRSARMQYAAILLAGAAPKPTLSGDVEPLLANARLTIASPGFDGFSALRDLKALVAALSSPLPGEE